MSKARRVPGRARCRSAVPVLLLALAGGLLALPYAARGATPWWRDPAAIARGAYLVATGPCISCHPLAGISNAGAAVDLSTEGRRRSIPWLLHELTHPSSPRPPIPAGEVRDIAAYLESLGTTIAAPAAAPLLRPAAVPSCRGDGATAAVTGRVTDAVTGRPLAHVFVVVGWNTLRRVGETDARGLYCVAGLPPAYVGLFGFAEGHSYFHGHPIALRPGTTLTYAFRIPRETVPPAMLPVLSGAAATEAPAPAGTTVTLSVHLRPGSGGTLSPEVLAMNGALGRVVVLAHRGSDVYAGTLTLPPVRRPTRYTFAFLGAMQSCLVNARYPRVIVAVTPSH